MVKKEKKKLFKVNLFLINKLVFLLNIRMFLPLATKKKKKRGKQRVTWMKNEKEIVQGDMEITFVVALTVTLPVVLVVEQTQCRDNL